MPWSASREARWAGATGLLALAAALLHFRPWNNGLSVPLTYEGDALWFLALFKGIAQHGWFLTNSSLGWPDVMNIRGLYHSGDNATFLMAWLVSRFVTGPGAIMNLVFYVQFPLDAAAAFLVMRRMAVGRPAALVCGALYAMLPYHVLRSERYVMLGLYAAVPFGILVLDRLLDGRPLFDRLRSRRTALTLLFCLAIAAAGTNYYAVLTIAVSAVIAPLAALAARSWRPLVMAGLLTVGIAAGLAVNWLPELVGHHQDSAQLVHRVPQDTEYYALNLARLVIPPETHRVAFAAHLGRRYSQSSRLPQAAEHAGYLGLVGICGLIILMAAATAALIGRQADPRLRRAALLALVIFLIGTTAGLATVFAYVVDPTFRSVGRIEPFLGFVALLGAAIALDAATGWLRTRRRSSLTVPALLAAVLGVGLYDQSVLSQDAPPLPAWQSDDAFVSMLERSLPRGAAVLQLPVVPVLGDDRWPVSQRSGNNPFRPYLHANHLRFSHGALLREQDGGWEVALSRRPPGELLRGAVAVGYRAVLIDRVAQGGASALGRSFADVAHVAPILSRDGRFAAYNLVSYARSLGAGARERIRRQTLAQSAVDHPGS